MLWAALDLDILEDPAFVELEDEVPGAFWLWCRILQQAKRVNQHGLVLRADGRPLDARDLHRIHRTASQDTWAGLLDRCVELELLELRDGVYRVLDWRRWHRSPSDMPDQVAARVARHRAQKRAEAQLEQPPETPVTDVTPCNAGNECNDTEQSRAEQLQSTPEQNQNKATPSNQTQRKATRGREGKPATLNGYAVSEPNEGAKLNAKTVPGFQGPAGLARALTHRADDPAEVLARLRAANESGQIRPP